MKNKSAMQQLDESTAYFIALLFIAVLGIPALLIYIKTIL